MSQKSISPNGYGKTKQISPLEETKNVFVSSCLIDECEKVDISSLLRVAMFELKKTLIQSQLQTEGVEVNLLTSKAGFGGQRLWFECPKCRRRVGAFYKHPMSGVTACRKCLGLKYRGSAKKGMVEALKN